MSVKITNVHFCLLVKDIKDVSEEEKDTERRIDKSERINPRNEEAKIKRLIRKMAYMRTLLQTKNITVKFS